MNKFFPVMALALALAVAYLPSCQKNSQIFGTDTEDLSSAVVGDRDSSHCDSLHHHNPLDSTIAPHGHHHAIDTTGGHTHPIDTTGTGGGHPPVDTTGHGPHPGGGHPGGPHHGPHGG